MKPKPDNYSKFTDELKEKSRRLPSVGDNSHKSVASTFHEVNAAQLIDVAKHIAVNEECSQKVIMRAYEIICEAHIFSDHINALNTSAMNEVDPLSVCHMAVEKAEKSKDGNPIRLSVLYHFLKRIGSPLNENSAAKLFNSFIQYLARNENYIDVVTDIIENREFYYEGASDDFRSNDWVRREAIQQVEYYSVLSLPTEPRQKKSSPIDSTAHLTMSYWKTDDVWWPLPTNEMIKAVKDQILTKSRTEFLSKKKAFHTLEKFKYWIEVTGSLSSNTVDKSQPRKADGSFVSNKDKGSFRGLDGKYE